VIGQLRVIFGAYCTGILVFGVLAALVLDTPDDALDVSIAVAVVAVVGLGSLVLGRLLPAELDASSDDRVRQTYRIRFFVRLAVAEAVLLVGFVLTFLTGSMVPYLLAIPFTAFGFARAAPSDGNLQQDQDALNATGATADLRAALS
jgi:hypothetical protein